MFFFFFADVYYVVWPMMVASVLDMYRLFSHYSLNDIV